MLRPSVTDDTYLGPALQTLLGCFKDLTITAMMIFLYNVCLKIWHMVEKLLGLTSKYVHLLHRQCHGLLILDVMVINQLWCSSRITIISTTIGIWRYGDQLILKFSKRIESIAHEKCIPYLFTCLFIVSRFFNPKTNVRCQKGFCLMRSFNVNGISMVGF